MTRLAFATYRKQPQLARGDDRAAAALARRGVRVDAHAWDADGVAWTAYDAVVLRSCWDYHERPDAFAGWVASLDAAGVPVWNPPALVAWNVDKRYLLELAALGVPTVPTAHVPRGSACALGALLAREGWDRAVVKPAVSADGHDTWLTSRRAAAEDQPRLDAMLARGDALVQRFVREVRADGEWSLVFLGGAFSHAVRKRPGQGDFRVQERFGGGSAAEPVDSALVREAEAILAHVPRPWLYARVDGCVVDGRLTLMELEMTEPSLFLHLEADAPERFADAVLAAVGAVEASSAD